MLALGVFLTLLLRASLLLQASAAAFNAKGKTNVVNYWGQNGADETKLADYCSGSIDVLVLSFLYQIKNGSPVLNLANHCTQTFPGSEILQCPEIEAGIQECQKKGKAIILSIGGANGDQSLPDAKAGEAFAQTIWDMFLGGNSTTRPFGKAIVDGVDLDLEQGEKHSYGGYPTFVKVLRAKFTSGSRPYYITSAPQCVYPDSSLQPVLDSSWFDMVFVQFYNNPPCAADSPNFNFNKWNEWATSTSVNKNVRVLLGVPGGPGGAGSGVLDKTNLTRAILRARSYPSFGGVMMWDAGRARKSGLAEFAAKVLHQNSTTMPTAATTTTTTTATTTGTGSGTESSTSTTLALPAGKGPVPTITMKVRSGETAMLTVHMLSQPEPTQGVTNYGSSPSLPEEAAGGVRPQVKSNLLRQSYGHLAIPYYRRRQPYDPRGVSQGMDFVIQAICK
ncbi:Chitinase 1 [Modicella reniformis]|uniref:chitinase n=1 Tax=Modicella reniformis TaxID=1440133 RepID=A0A9P6SQR1_9FUNG|nr:Chitinase 1 [Modicella reniformis]